jgi:hypothetical protein
MIAEGLLAKPQWVQETKQYDYGYKNCYYQTQSFNKYSEAYLQEKRNKGFHLLIRLSSLITRRIKGSAAAEQFSFSYKPIVIYWYFIHT